MKRSDLEALGLEKTIIDSVMALHGRSEEEYKAIETNKNRIAELEEQLKNANSTIDSLKENQNNAEEIKKQADEYKANYENLVAKRNKEIFTNAIEKELNQFKVRDSKSVMAHLDMEKITYENGVLNGLKEQVEPLKTTKDFLFEGTTVITNPNHGNGQNVNPDKAYLDSKYANNPYYRK